MFLVDFHSARLFVLVFGTFWGGFHIIWGQLTSWGMSMGQISVFALFGFCSLGRFGAFWLFLRIFGVSVAIWWF